MQWARAALFSTLFALPLACGGSSSGAASEESSSAGAEVEGDRTEGGRRRATEGASCDYGGVADHTCLRGLYCCYGPPDDPGEQGTCMPECPEY